MHNHSGDEHPVHRHRHTFEVTKVGDRPMSGLMKNTISMKPSSQPKLERLRRSICLPIASMDARSGLPVEARMIDVIINAALSRYVSIHHAEFPEPI
jgi:FtsP/CotA-like multicopper oxidase with cupredoxin domain